MAGVKTRQGSRDLGLIADSPEIGSGAAANGGVLMRDQNVLAACMVDGDTTMVRGSRRTLRRALLLAIALEAALLAALLLVPLASPGVLPRRVILIPSSPYGAGTNPGSAARRKDARLTDPKLPIHDPIKWPLPQFLPPLHAGAGPSAGDPSAVGLPPLGLDNGGPPELSGILGSTGPAMVDTPTPPKPRPALRRVHSGGEVEQALLMHRVEPRYPALARQIRLEGTVRLHAVIGIGGVVRQLEVESGHPLLANAALDAVRQWRYRPTRLNGEPVEVETTITVIFRLGP